MNRFKYFGGGSVLAITLLLGAPAYAQGVDTDPGPVDQTTEVEEIVVTGSLIRGTPEDAALPVDVIGQEELEKQGSPSTVELLKALPVSNGVLGDTNQFDARAQGSEGSGSVNLRGLGPQRTLVLMNGRRMVANPFGQVGTGIVDTNVIPVAAIGRIEVLKDGAAATYGSDAIGGVVNFITRTNFDGLEVGGSYRFIDGSDGDWTGHVVWGLGTDNADVLLAFGMQHRSKLPITEKDWATRPYLENPEGGWSSGNAVTTFLPLYSPAAGVFAPAAGLTSDVGCTPLGGFQGRTSTGTAACFWNYTPYDNLVEIEDRYQLYGQVDFDLNENHSFHAEALYSETDVPEWNTSPSYLALQTPTATTNPAWSPGLSAGYFVPASNPGLALYRTQNPTAIPAFANGVYIPGVLYRPYSFGGNPMFGNGPSRGTRNYEFYRVSGGFQGDWENGWGYDVAMTYSQQTGVRTGFDTVVSRFQLALRGFGSLASDAADGDGCTAAETANYTTNAGNAALGCYYFNPFSNSIAQNVITGQQNPNFNAAIANTGDLTRWFFVENYTKQTQRLFVADAVINGGTGINLAGGEIKWALGAQLRRDYFVSEYNDLTDLDVTPCIDTPITGSTTCTIRNGPMMFLGGGFESDLESHVYAYFGELAVPVTDAIQMQLAARFEDYGGRVGSTFDPKLSLRWQMLDWFALRTSIGTTFRGPPQTQLAPGSVTSLQFLGGAFKAVDIFGNESLEPESATTFSVGALFDLDRFNATIDYWSFDFENPIVAEPGGQVFSAMFPTGTGTGNCADPAYDALETRFTFQTGVCSVANISRIRTAAVNGPGIKTSGVDVLADYEVGDLFGGEVRIGSSFTYVHEYVTDDFTVEGVVIQPSFDAAGKLNYQTSAYPIPQWKGSAYAEYETGPHNIRWTVNYIDGYDDQRASIRAPNPNVPGGNCPTPPTPFVLGCGLPILTGLQIDRMITHDLDYRFMAPWDTTLVVSVDNVLDEEPPFARLDLNYDPFTHNGLGRTIKVALTKKF